MKKLLIFLAFAAALLTVREASAAPSLPTPVTASVVADPTTGVLKWPTAPNFLTNLGATTVGGNLLKLTNPGAVRYLRLNADNTVTARTAAELLVTDLGGVPLNGAGGTPSSITLTNGTGLPLSGISGFGTGVATALAVNTGGTGAVVLYNGAYGTPASLTLTNATGLPAAGVTGLGTLATKDVPVCTSYARNGANQTLTDATTVTLSWPTAVKADASFNGTTFTAPATGYADLTGIFDLSCTPALGDSSKGNLTVLVRDATAGANVQIIYDGIEVFSGTLADTSQHINTAFPLLASVAVTSGHAYQIFCTWDNGGDDAATQRGFIQWEMKP